MVVNISFSKIKLSLTDDVYNVGITFQLVTLISNLLTTVQNLLGSLPIVLQAVLGPVLKQLLGSLQNVLAGLNGVLGNR